MAVPAYGRPIVTPASINVFPSFTTNIKKYTQFFATLSCNGVVTETYAVEATREEDTFD